MMSALAHLLPVSARPSVVDRPCSCPKTFCTHLHVSKKYGAIYNMSVEEATHDVDFMGMTQLLTNGLETWIRSLVPVVVRVIEGEDADGDATSIRSVHVRDEMPQRVRGATQQPAPRVLLPSFLLPLCFRGRWPRLWRNKRPLGLLLARKRGELLACVWRMGWRGKTRQSMTASAGLPVDSGKCDGRKRRRHAGDPHRRSAGCMQCH